MADFPVSGVAGIAEEVRKRIRTEINVAIGGHFRDSRAPAEVVKFYELLSALIAGARLPIGPVQQRVHAFFMIRHTEVIGHRMGVPVDPSLIPMLREVCEDTAVKSHLGKYRRPMMRANNLE